MIDRSAISLFSRDVINMISEGQDGWKSMVPEPFTHIVKERGLRGYQA